MTSINRDEWMKALGESFEPPDPNALTTREVAAMFGIGFQAALIRLRKLVAEGKAETATKIIPRGNGWYRVSAYRLIKPKGKKR